MARYTGPSCKLCRREGEKLFLKGTRCETEKCAVSRRSYAPGMHGKVPKRRSSYGGQLREKQMVKRIYGVLERQFRRYFRIAARAKGVTGEMLLSLLERRLDNVVFRARFATSRSQARQFARHGLIYVNKRRVTIPSYSVRPNDVITIKQRPNILKRIQEIHGLVAAREIPKWIEVDEHELKATILRLPERADITLPINEQLIVELYSK